MGRVHLFGFDRYKKNTVNVLFLNCRFVLSTGFTAGKLKSAERIQKWANTTLYGKDLTIRKRLIIR